MDTWTMEVVGRGFRLQGQGQTVMIGSKAMAQRWAKVLRKAGQEDLAWKLDQFAYGIKAECCK